MVIKITGVLMWNPWVNQSGIGFPVLTDQYDHPTKSSPTIIEIIQLFALTRSQYRTATVVGKRTAKPVNACETMSKIVSGGS